MSRRATFPRLLEDALLEFPAREIWLETPPWLEALGEEHWLNEELTGALREAAGTDSAACAITALWPRRSPAAISRRRRCAPIRLNEGAVEERAEPKNGLFYTILSEQCGENIEGEEHLMSLMQGLVRAKKAYDRVESALASAREDGYGLVMPVESEMTLDKPEIVRQGNRFGVKLKASAPSLHIIRVDIQTELSPVMGAEKQSEELAAVACKSEVREQPHGQPVDDRICSASRLGDLVP